MHRVCWVVPYENINSLIAGDFKFKYPWNFNFLFTSSHGFVVLYEQRLLVCRQIISYPPGVILLKKSEILQDL